MSEFTLADVPRDPRVDADAPGLSDEEVVIIAHFRGYRHLSTACRACKAERLQIEQVRLQDLSIEHQRRVTAERNRLILAERRRGGTVSFLADNFQVSRGTVQAVINADKLRHALKLGGNTNPPSIEDLMHEVSNPTKDRSVLLLLKHAAKTGEVL